MDFNALVFGWLLRYSKREMVRMESTKGFVPFRKLENETHCGLSINFSVMKDRRRRSRFSITRTFLVQAEIHQNASEKLKAYNDVKMIAVDVPGAVFFSEVVIADVLVNQYLDYIIQEHQK